MTSVITTLINEARSPNEFSEAARVVESLVVQGKGDPGVVANLALRGHALIDGGGWTLSGVEQISRSVVRVIVAEPRLRDNGHTTTHA